MSLKIKLNKTNMFTVTNYAGIKYNGVLKANIILSLAFNTPLLSYLL